MSDPNKTPVISVGGALSHAEPRVSIAGAVAGPIQSPTGIPVLSPKATPYIAAGGAILLAISEVIPPYTVVGKVIHGAVGLLSLFGIISPGLRINSMVSTKSQQP